jgi:hypothetical protein
MARAGTRAAVCPKRSPSPLLISSPPAPVAAILAKNSLGVAQPVRTPDLTVLIEGARKCADTTTVDSSERSHEAALEQVHRETRRLRNSLDGGGRHDICTHHGVRQLIPQRGPAMRSGPSSCHQVRPPHPGPAHSASSRPHHSRLALEPGGRTLTDDLPLTVRHVSVNTGSHQHLLFAPSTTPVTPVHSGKRSFASRTVS